jgi:hypothetical protein
MIKVDKDKPKWKMLSLMSSAIVGGSFDLLYFLLTIILLVNLSMAVVVYTTSTIQLISMFLFFFLLFCMVYLRQIAARKKQIIENKLDALVNRPLDPSLPCTCENLTDAEVFDLLYCYGHMMEVTMSLKKETGFEVDEKLLQELKELNSKLMKFISKKGH